MIGKYLPRLLSFYEPLVTAFEQEHITYSPRRSSSVLVRSYSGSDLVERNLFRQVGELRRRRALSAYLDHECRWRIGYAAVPNFDVISPEEQ